MDKPHREQIEERLQQVEELLRQKADDREHWDLEQQLKVLQEQHERTIERVNGLEDRASDIEGRLDALEGETP